MIAFCTRRFWPASPLRRAIDRADAAFERAERRIAEADCDPQPRRILDRRFAVGCPRCGYQHPYDGACL